ncbi:hypothetical protein [Solibacillus sp. FSL H8-0538]|uniref:hypothetical protein n=1 Tax=Solibacillus sp. FSL H8-0538 TaxID=2921400 RepID=UPI0030FAC412
MDSFVATNSLQVNVGLIVLIFTVFTLLQHLIFGLIYSKLVDGLGMEGKKLWAWLPGLNLLLFYVLVKEDKGSQNAKTLLIVASLFLAILPAVPLIYLYQGNVESGIIFGAVNMIILQVFFYGYGVTRFNRVFDRRFGSYN